MIDLKEAQLLTYDERKLILCCIRVTFDAESTNDTG